MTIPTNHSFDLGRHDALIASLKDEIAEMRQDMRDMSAMITEVRDYMAERRGERRAATWAASMAGAVMGFLASIVLKMVDVLLSRYTT